MRRVVKKNNNLVSIVIPTYLPLRTLKKCLESLEAQTYQEIEIIIVDSTPQKIAKHKVKEMAQKYGRYFFDGPERSIQRNRGIKEAKGKYILTIDQDMYLTRNVIKDCVSAIERNRYIALIIPEISIGEGYWTQCVALERYVSIYLEEGMNECCRFFRKKDALAIGCYDPTIVGVEDSDFHYRMAKKGSIGKIKSHIVHDEGRTTFLGRVKKKYYYSRAFRLYLERHPEIAVKQFFPIKKAYFKHWQYLAKKPQITIGIIMLRSAEVVAGAIGVVQKSK